MEDDIQQQKNKIYKQIESLPKDKQEEIKKKIEEMSDEKFKDFLIQNSKTKQCLFCSIIKNEIEYVKLFENDDAIAILEINPKSKGHSLILSKTHEGKITGKMIELSKLVGSQIVSAYSPKEVNVNEGKIFGHTILEIIPNYENEQKEEKRTIEELNKIRDEILSAKQISENKIENKELQQEEIKEPIKINNPKENKQLPHFNKRIP